MTKKELNEARFRGNCVYGYFNAYCFLHSSCDECIKSIRFLCKVKDKIEKLQTKLILRSCEEDILACKNCGSDPVLRKVGNQKELFIYQCPDCFKSPNNGEAKCSSKAAKEVWNKLNS